MSSVIDEYRIRLRKALAQLEEMEDELKAVHAERAEPIAVIGMACRFPGGANCPEDYFKLLTDEVDAVTEVPTDRWKLPPLDTDADADERAKHWGAFIKDYDLFDAGFFGISPREAQAMDPQQRLLLELTWEALERAGQVPEQMSGSNTSVFIGISQTDSIWKTMLDRSEATYDFYDVIGNGHCFASGRISYALGFEGPSAAVDTACSSSLVAIHLACQSLRLHESDMAIAGGVNLMLAPGITHLIATSHGLSPDGRCKTFDASANGFVRGEGAGVVILKRLSDAQLAGDPILAIIRGSAINQDGRSAGIAAPNVRAQETVLRRALASARLMADDIGYVEMHGTGTPLGDPIEASALQAVFGKSRDDLARCVLGAVKTNIAHLEAAAGVAGFMKTVLVLANELIPKNLHFQALNPRISFDGTPFVVPTEPIKWPRDNKPRRAGVSSFGMSGTNAHVIVEEAPWAPQTTNPEKSAYLLPLSAKHADALAALSDRYAQWLPQASATLSDIAYTATLRRGHHDFRLAAVAQSREEFAALLAAAARGELPGGLVRGRRIPQKRAAVVFVFPGQGSQWAGMGRQLLAEEPAFREAIDACDAVVQRESHFSIVAELQASDDQSRLGEIDVVQPVLFAVEVALAALWRAWGIEPDCVVGHSMGEVAAAHVAGMLSLEDAASVICRRSRLLKTISGQGAMGLVELPMAEAEKAIVGYESRLSVAVSNGPRSTVLSGDPAALEQVLATLEKRGVFCRRVKVDVASHSPQVESLRVDLLHALRDVRPMNGSVRLHSTVTGKALQGTELVATYWWDNLRQPVRFSQTSQELMREGMNLFIEMSPHPVLLPAIEENLKETRVDGAAIASLRRHSDERRSMLEALGSLYVSGANVDWEKLHPIRGQVVSLPSYPWQRDRYPVEAPKDRPAPTAVVHRGAHPLLGLGFAPASQPGLHVWEQHVGLEAFGYLTDHRVQGEVVFPGAGYIELAMAAGAQVFGEKHVQIDDVSFQQMMALTKGTIRIVQVSLLEEGGGRASITISSKPRDGNEWIRHASATVRIAATEAPALDTRENIDSRFPETLAAATHYEHMEARGVSYGNTFRGVQELHFGIEGVVCRVQRPAELEADSTSYYMHPALLDACIQAGTWAMRDVIGGGTFVPVKASRIRLYERPGDVVWVHGKVVSAEKPSVMLIARDHAGKPLFEIGELVVQKLEIKSTSGADEFADCIFDVAWEKRSPQGPPRNPNGAWLVIMDGRGLGRGVVERLRTRRQTCIEVTLADGYARLNETHYRVDPANVQHWATVFGNAFGNRPCSGVIDCAPVDCTPWAETTETSLRTDVRRMLLTALRVSQALLNHNTNETPRLYLLTRGAQAIDTESKPVSVVQAALWGFGRSLAMERRDLRSTCIDLSLEGSYNELDQIVDELLSSSSDEQVALRPLGRYVARVKRGTWPESGPAAQRRERAAGRPFRLETHEPGILDKLALRPLERKAPGPLEVEIEVVAAGINFLDVLLALGVLPDDVASGNAENPRLGGECAGRIVRVGSDVTDLRVGQEVIALASSAIATHVIATQKMVVPKPASLSWTDAATIPIAFMTAYYALGYVGRVQPGERVLIHAGAGGVGMAAIQWAKHAGAEVFATAGSEEKRALLRSMGVEHVMDSRSLSFVDDVMRITRGEGVDVVLNSLAGEFLTASLGLLRDHGRFIEIGKKDYYENRPIGLRPFLKNLSFSLVDLRAMTINHPNAVATLFGEVMDFLVNGIVTPLPVRAYPISNAIDAFTAMAQGKHSGKLALEMRDTEAEIAFSVERNVRIRPDGSYLITGGLGGLGFTLARWLVDKGARTLALVGRNAPNAAMKTAIAQWQARGVDVRTFQADVSHRVELDAVISNINRATSPLRGVVHAAGILSDRTIAEMGEDELLLPFGPKVFGAWNLHRATHDVPLDFFVTYSSAAALLGSPGQANYAAANAFLDGLCQARGAMGLAATSIQWGAFQSIGLVAAAETRRKRIMARTGDGFEPTQGTALFARAIGLLRNVVAIMRLDLQHWRESFPHVAKMPYFEALLNEAAGTKDESPTASMFLESVKHARYDQRIMLVEKQVLLRIGQVLRLDPSRIDRLATFSSIGIDSLMSLELRNRLEPDFELKLSATMLFAHPTPAALAEHLLSRITISEPPPPTAVVPVLRPYDVGSELPLESSRELVLPEQPVAPVATVDRIPTPAPAPASPDDLEAQLEAKLASLSKYLD